MEQERVNYICNPVLECTINQIQKKTKMATVTVEKSDIDQLVEFTKNTNWLVENIDNLRSKHHDRYVAVFDSGNQILDAHTKQDLIEKIIRLGRNPETAAIDFVTLERYLLIL